MQRPAFIASAVLIALVSLEVGAVLVLDRGIFVYAIDDPYIHLALSERIAEGHYGLNPGEWAAPSSSLVWPFLLAPFASFRWHEFMPLLYGTLSVVATLFVGDALLKGIGLHATRDGRICSSVLLISWTVALASPAHVLSGMEHSLQLALTATAVLGLVRVIEQGRAPWWLFTALVLAPMVRYESIAVLFAGGFVLAALRRWIAAMVTTASGIAPLGIFGLILTKNGLAPVPSSVLVKSNIAGTTLSDWACSALHNLQANLMFDRTGVVLIALVLAALFRSPRPQGEGLLAWAAALVTAAHALFGNAGSLGRYVLFVITFDSLTLAFLWRRELVAAIETGANRLALSAAIVMALAMPYNVKLLFEAPFMANNNYQQQHQLARFLAEYWRDKVALTELGRMSYRYKGYVLDLWGLGSEEARRLRLAARTGWLQTMVAHHDVGLAIIYEDWFPGQIPPAWRKIAVLEIDRRNMILPSSRIDIYATDPQRAERVRAALASFAPTVPEGSSLLFADQEVVLTLPSVSSRSK